MMLFMSQGDRILSYLNLGMKICSVQLNKHALRAIAPVLDNVVGIGNCYSRRC
ncbi:hypothetical protein IQ259_26115 [Fortiea sp. LEGE XX443]|uniref:hypothetical protein n=1 Tax=Fortiea sp. LEGE XX443 TaxID=1828611 RepID=UPI00187F7479|nr:hypothetical protein [Fortiea sp. LEGE XX443]MBE9008429.1 hypothetical protein [Fortiea sp. LEGE XX443]